MFFYILYKIGYIIANALPLGAAYWVAEVFSNIQYSVAKKDRDAVLQNLSILLKKDKKECRVLAQQVFRNFGLYLVDFFRMRRLDKEAVKKRVTVEGIENIDRVLAQNKGVIALTCHIGNWEMGGVVMGIKGYNISAVVLNHKHKSINDFFIRQREEKGLKAIPMSSVMKRCVSTLLNKEILALAGDRDFTNSGIKLDFFGMHTNIPKGPAALSLKTDSPIVPAFFIREDRFNYRFIFDNPIEAKKRPDTKEDDLIRETTQEFVSVMEGYIRRYPEQWLLFRRFWEVPQDAFVI
ncbi:lysophospholipid acyltransferase family protein [Candidatus Omnitrophota bacterium]